MMDPTTELRHACEVMLRQESQACIIYGTASTAGGNVRMLLRALGRSYDEWVDQVFLPARRQLETRGQS